MFMQLKDHQMPNCDCAGAALQHNEGGPFLGLNSHLHSKGVRTQFKAIDRSGQSHIQATVNVRGVCFSAPCRDQNHWPYREVCVGGKLSLLDSIIALSHLSLSHKVLQRHSTDTLTLIRAKLVSYFSTPGFVSICPF